MVFKSLLKRRKRRMGRSEDRAQSGTENQKLKSFTKRAFLIATGQGLAISVLGARLAYLQIKEGEKYSTLSEENRINILMLAPERGQIVDRYGVPLALNTRDFRAVIVPEKTTDIKSVLLRLKDHIALSDEDIDKVLKTVKRSSRFTPVEIVNNLSWEDVARLEVHRPNLPGIMVEVGNIRNYPLKDTTSHLVGYVGRVSEKELSGAPVELLPGYKIGKTALEKKYNDLLKGEPGQRDVEVNAVGREIRDLQRENAVTGERLTLSVDAEYQRFVQDRLASHQSASAVVMDAHTGAIYALASYPGFDPNLFVDGIGVQAWNELLYDPAFPLTNKAVTGQYPPGSTYKMVTALAGLEAGLIKPGTTHHCPGHYDLGNHRFHCWKRGGHGRVNLTEALAQSCDTFFYKVAHEMDIDTLKDVSLRMGLGQEFGGILPEEKPGFIPDKDWKQRRYGEKWQPGETIVASIGQGYVLTTPLQLATMTARLINGGKQVNPWLVGYEDEKPMFTTEWPEMNINHDHLDLIKRGMDAVVMGPTGTARGSRIADPSYSMSGKTGTAQVKRITTEERARGVRRQEDLPWNLRHHALFVGYGPVENPRYVCSVVVEHGIGGSSAAAPIARDLLLEIQKRDPASTPLKPNGGLSTARNTSDSVRKG
ncbi:MAG: penicillin-binding protein 2 [Micavibrio sp.]|nr:penicillin-binding protein 2 [Micavibrio sp.]